MRRYKRGGRFSWETRGTRPRETASQADTPPEVSFGCLLLLCAFLLLFDATFWWGAVPLGVSATFGIVLLGAGFYDSSSVFRGVRRRRLFAQHSASLATDMLVLSLIKEHQAVLMNGFLWKEATKPTEWKALKREFYRTTVAPQLAMQPAATNYDEERFVMSADSFLRSLAGMAPPVDDAVQPTVEATEPLTPLGFEKECASKLRAVGWTTSCTPNSGDQGADVVGEKNGERFVFQCKLYGRPVGNKAVQEAYAAKAFYGASRAAVISNSGYTASARNLAASTGVILLTPRDLHSLQTETGH
jgi:HJR/Mrr/RecB family endonuclease